MLPLEHSFLRREPVGTRLEAISQLVKMLNLTRLAPQAVPLRGERDTTNPPCPSPFGEGRLSAAKRGEVRQSADSEMTSCLVPTIKNLPLRDLPLPLVGDALSCLRPIKHQKMKLQREKSPSP